MARKYLNKKEALSQFREEILPNLPKDDKPCIQEQWNNYTDILHKEGKISEYQYNNWSNPF